MLLDSTVFEGKRSIDLYLPAWKNRWGGVTNRDNLEKHSSRDKG